MLQTLRFMVVAIATLVGGPGIAFAQDQSQMKFPSFNSVVAKPQGVATGETPDPAVTAPSAPATAPVAKSKPKPVKTAVRNEPAAPKGIDAKGLSIAVLVNDDPITGYEIEQRQRIMGLSANVGEKAQASFKRMLQDPSTSEKIESNPGRNHQGKSGEVTRADHRRLRRAQEAVCYQPTKAGCR